MAPGEDLICKRNEMSAWLQSEEKRSGVSIFGDIKTRLRKYYDAMDGEMGKFLAGIEAGEERAADDAAARIKSLYGRAVDRLKENERRQTQC